MSESIEPALSWRIIPGFDGCYEASTHGTIRRAIAFDSLHRPRRAGVLKPSLVRGYERVSLSVNDVTRTCSVHRLIAAAFHGPRSADDTVNHIDGRKQNNRPDNLEYVSVSENIRHAKRTGLNARGSRHGSAKLSEPLVLGMREMRRRGMTYRAIALVVGVDETTASRAVRGMLWRTAVA